MQLAAKSGGGRNQDTKLKWFIEKNKAKFSRIHVCAER